MNECDKGGFQEQFIICSLSKNASLMTCIEKLPEHKVYGETFNVIPNHDTTEKIKSGVLYYDLNKEFMLWLWIYVWIIFNVIEFNN